MVENEEGRPTLLEDIETLHRDLTGLENVKGYVQIIEHALKLRFAGTSLYHFHFLMRCIVN